MMTAAEDSSFAKRYIEPLLRSWRTHIPQDLSNSYFPTAITTTLGGLSLPKSINKQPGFPPFLQSCGFASMFALSTYAIRSGDMVNGPSLATGWSLIYLLTNTLPSIRSRNIGAISILSATLMQVGVYGISTAEDFYWGDRLRAVNKI